MKKSMKNGQPGQGQNLGQGQGGPGQSGTLYDLSSIYK